MAGHIEERGNSFRLVYMKDKKKHCKTVKAASPKAAEKELAKFIAEIEGNNFIEPSKITFETFIKRWLTEYAERDLAPKTVHRYKQILDTRVIPALGHLKLEQIRPVHLIEFYNNLTEDGIRKDGKKGGLSGKTIMQHHRIISSILNDAVQWQVIGSNPASRVKPPKVQRKEAKYYDELQTALLLETVEKDSIKKKTLKHKTLVHFALFGGMRRGEIMGAEWGDMDFEEKTIRVERSSQYIPGHKELITKDPKNETSKRLISLPASLVTLLKQYKAEQNEHRLKLGDKWQESDRLFTTWDGRPGHPDWPSRWFCKFVKEKNLPPLNFHGLRHTSITLLISQGCDIAAASKRAGHANVSTTGNIYSHALKSADRDAADKLENLFSEKLKKQA
ncbi:MAG: integrase [Peptococcaceae bacterium BRH_c4b]|nr:MAG: integrase [Peptococcaceae bacterium BRH_c4b]